MKDQDRIWRLRGVPQHFNKETLTDALRIHPNLQWPRNSTDAQTDDNHGDGDSNDDGDNGAAVHTLARDGRHQIATVRFCRLPLELERLPKGGHFSINLSLSSSRPTTGDKRKRDSLQTTKAIIDDNFDGLTTLFSPERHDFDILAVSGLGSHPFGSFADKQDQHMWLADSLPHDVPTARVMIYGQDTTLQNSTSFAELGDLASSFQSALCQILRQEQVKRLVLIGHSLGGLLIKEALIRLSESGAEADLLGMIAGCLFFGVPNDGMKIESLVPMVGDQPNRSLLQSLRDMNSQVLRTQKRKFSSVVAETQIQLFCFYETELSPTAVEVNGRYTMTGSPHCLVTQSSATSCLPQNSPSTCSIAIHRTHSGLVKYFASYDPEYKKVLDILKQINSKPARIRDSQGSLQTMQAADCNGTTYEMNGQDVECLRNLRVVDPRDEMKRIENSKDELLDDSYTWILRTKEYEALTNWDNDNSNLSPCRLLWIKGLAGTGKTMLLMGIIKHLSNRLSMHAPALSCFFFQRTDMNLNNATAALRSLIWLLLVQQPRLILHLRQQYKVSGPALFTDGNAFHALSTAFRNMLNDRDLLPVYFVVDALDECDQSIPGLGKLVQLISDSLSLSDKVRWLVSSRPEADVVAQLKALAEKKQGNTNPHISGTLIELETQVLAEPVSAYIKHKLSGYEGRPGYTDGVLAEISDEVRRRAENTFLWVALVFKTLDSESGWHAVEIIKAMPSGLLELYDHMMTRLEREGLDLQHCKNVLATVSLAYRPLSLPELALLAGLSPRVDPQTIVDKCVSYLTTKSGSVCLIHQSAKEFLDLRYVSKLHQCGPVQGHADISKRSIEGMSGLRRNIYNSPHFGIQHKDIMPPDPDPLDPIRYSCVFWIDHVCNMSPESNNELWDDRAVFVFLKEHFLHWIEAMSLMSKLSDAVRSIKKLLHVAQTRSTTELGLVSFLTDAERFTLHHRYIIELAPAQAYGSALVFSPMMSEIKKWQWKERLPFIKAVVGVRDHWGARLQTFEGHREEVNSIALSPDGKILASASEDSTVRLWDITTGAHQETFEGHRKGVVSVTFSPDGKILASASADRTVRLWDIATGKHQQTIATSNGEANTVAFSPDGKTLALASDDGTVWLWDMTIGRHQQTLGGHLGGITSVAFSRDGKKIATADETTVRIWDAATRACSHTLEVRHWERMMNTNLLEIDWRINAISAVTFSPDNKTLAIASWGGIVRVWDVTTAACRYALPGHFHQIGAIAFSPDSKILASGSTEVDLWDMATGMHIQTIDGHRGGITSIAFSIDGKKLISASDRIIRLWDIKMARQQPFGQLNSFVWQAIFSPDGKVFAIGFGDGIIRLWDAATGRLALEANTHTNTGCIFAFSPDSKMLAVCSDQNMISTWDVTSTTFQQSFEGPADEIRTFGFSPDGKIIVSASFETVWLWDIAASRCQCTIKSTDRYLGNFAFSLDSKLLALVFHNDIIRIYDTATATCIHKLTIEGGMDLITDIAISPNGKMLASTSYDKKVRLWSITTGIQQWTTQTNQRFESIVFSEDGQHLRTSRGSLRLTWESSLYNICFTEKVINNALFVRDVWTNWDDRWLYRDGKDLIWIPKEYQDFDPVIHNNRVILGNGFGEMVFLELEF